MFRSNTIGKRVLAVIKQKIDELEEKYEEACELIDEEAAARKADIADETVNKLIGHLIND